MYCAVAALGCWRTLLRKAPAVNSKQGFDFTDTTLAGTRYGTGDQPVCGML